MQRIQANRASEIVPNELISAFAFKTMERIVKPVFGAFGDFARSALEVERVLDEAGETLFAEDVHRVGVVDRAVGDFVLLALSVDERVPVFAQVADRVARDRRVQTKGGLDHAPGQVPTRHETRLALPANKPIGFVTIRKLQTIRNIIRRVREFVGRQIRRVQTHRRNQRQIRNSNKSGFALSAAGRVGTSAIRQSGRNGHEEPEIVASETEGEEGVAGLAVGGVEFLAYFIEIDDVAGFADVAFGLGAEVAVGVVVVLRDAGVVVLVVDLVIQAKGALVHDQRSPARGNRGTFDNDKGVRQKDGRVSRRAY